MWEESDSRTPMVCFLSMGSDPTASIEALAKKLRTDCRNISMGQGQEVHARRLLTQFMNEGGWVLLQNCHLGLGFMDELLETVTTGLNNYIDQNAFPTFYYYVNRTHCYSHSSQTEIRTKITRIVFW